MLSERVSPLVIGLALATGCSSTQEAEVALPVLPQIPNQQEKIGTESISEQAKARVLTIYAELEAMGLTTGPGDFAQEPLQIEGQPVVALVVGDRHTEQDHAKMLVCVETLREKYNIHTIFLEGIPGDGTTIEQVGHACNQFHTEAKSLVLSSVDKANCGVEDSALESAYSTSETEAQPAKFSRTLGIESKNSQANFHLALCIDHRLAGEYLLQKLQAGEQVLVSVDGKYVNEMWARAMHAQPRLQSVFGESYPTMSLKEGELTGTPDGQVHTVEYMEPSDLQQVLGFMERLNSFWVVHNIKERNHQAAELVHEFFSAPEQKENLVVIVIGAGHLFSTPLTPPSLQNELSKIGISAASVLPFPIKVGVDPKSGMICEIE